MNPGDIADLLQMFGEDLASRVMEIPREERTQARQILASTFQIEQRLRDDPTSVPLSEVRQILQDLDSLLVQVLPTRDAIDIARLTDGWRSCWPVRIRETVKAEMIPWLTNFLDTDERFQARIEWLFERSEKAAQTVGGLMKPSDKTAEDTERHDHLELVVRRSPKKRR
ncbi:MAG: hypothetical protein CMH54_15685 [Myxococcales bacterium]|nr:hypothetical protein [Myxococcales bacterium]|tara:strand:+ start:340 stop:846 length:507 start_codon:yes stop_codon:yes gene_type:complete